MKSPVFKVPYPNNASDLVRMFEIGGAEAAKTQWEKARLANLTILGCVDGKLADLTPDGNIVFRNIKSLTLG